MILGIALDFDGVMNSLPFIWKVKEEERRSEYSFVDWQWYAEHVDPKHVVFLNQIVEKTGAKVFISSTWRILLDVENIQTILNHHGFIGEVIGLTPRTFQMEDGTWSGRGNEIQAFLDKHPEIEKFVILDDESNMGHLTNRLVKTDIMVGLQQQHADQTIQMLDCTS